MSSSSAIKDNVLHDIFVIDTETLQDKIVKNSQSSSSSRPDTVVIENIQKSLQNSLYNLTIKDYRLMCDNDNVHEMMAKILECDVKQLKKFCKYINVFIENINLSPKDIRDKMKPKIKPNMTINDLPSDLRLHIIEKYKDSFKEIKYVLKHWIREENLIFDTLSKNPNAIDLLKNNETKLYWPYISMNPNAIEILKKNTNKIDWKILSGNPNAIELLENKIIEENSLGYNELYNLHSSKKIDWFELSKNPKAIKLIKKYKNKIDWKGLSENPNAITLLEEKIIEENKMDIEEFNNLDYSKTISRNMLSSNPNAVGLLIKYKIIDWKYLSENPDPEAIKLLEKKINKENKMTQEQLNRLDESKKISWQRLSRNPNAIELLKKKINEEKQMTQGRLDSIGQSNKIYWPYISMNPNAIELLTAEENKNKIDWLFLSVNPNPKAIELLENNYEQISWPQFSANPSIFTEVLINKY
jgi:hypothetical protein